MMTTDKTCIHCCCYMSAVETDKKSFIHFWHVSLVVGSTKCGHQSPSGRFWTTSFRGRLLDFRSCWIVFIHIHVVRGRPGGLLQFSKEEAIKNLASVSSGTLHNVVK